MNFERNKEEPARRFRVGILIFLAGNGIAVAEQPVDRISVTATRIERATKEVPSAISVIDSDQIAGARMMNIKDAIQGTPGVLIDSKNGGYDVRLIVRGAGQKANYGVREIMVLRDGVPMT
ncbi:MAG: Plug domain-containing protein, partial [Gammaproteobacteria bacterium]|nr:Plug domain-containing protein [Gammaproteobacteria bacterium]